MKPKRRQTSSPLTADAGSCKKTGDSPQEQEEELNEGRRHVMFRLKRSQERSLRPRTGPVVDQGFTDITGKSLKKDVIGFPTQSEQMTTDEKFSEEAVLEKMPSTSVSSLTDYSSSAPLFSQRPLLPLLSKPLLGIPFQTAALCFSSTTRHGHDMRSSLFSSEPPYGGSSYPEKNPVVGQGFTYTEASRFPVQSREPGGDHSAKDKTGPPFIDKFSLSERYVDCAASCPSAADGSPGVSQDDTREMEPPPTAERGSRCLTHSHSFPSLSQKTSANLCLPDMKLKTSVEEYTPDITADEDDETFSFQCSCPGLYHCSVTGLVFHMEGGEDVVYRIVPWNRRLLAQHHKQPAGPLFDIKCLQQSVCRLHLPHCEIRSGCEFLSVAHVNDAGIEFIGPHEVTETHVIINITGFSAFGNVKDEDSPPDPVQALVLLFYRPPADPDPESLLNVLLLPRNVVLWDVLRCRKKLVGDERYIETSPHCKLHPKQEYTLSTCPEDSVLVQPKEAEFDGTSYDNYFPSFQLDLETVMKHIQLVLRDQSSHSVWERRVCLSSTGVKRSCGPSALNLPPDEKLLDIRSSFIDRISGPALKSLLDKLFEKTVMIESEKEFADDKQKTREEKATFVIDTVRNKGEAASSEMIKFLCEIDPYLCKHLGLTN